MGVARAQKEDFEPEAETGRIIDASQAQGEGVSKKQGVSFSRKIWLLAPWLIMVAMVFVTKESVALAGFVTAIVGFVASFFGTKNKGAAKTPEGLCVLLTASSAVVELVNPMWVLNIALPLGILGAGLFLIIGNLNWED